MKSQRVKTYGWMCVYFTVLTILAAGVGLAGQDSELSIAPDGYLILGFILFCVIFLIILVGNEYFKPIPQILKDEMDMMDTINAIKTIVGKDFTEPTPPGYNKYP